MASLTDHLQHYFQYPSFQSVQQAVISRLVEQKGHSLVILPTGGGKSLCFQLPALIFEGGTIVISPLIALMQDQVDALQRKGIPATFINATVSASARRERAEAFRDGKVKLLYVTPERFRKPEFVEIIQQSKIDLLAVDEAHCISEWGHDFRPDYSRLAEFRQLMGNPLTIALTATATPAVQKDIITKLGLTPETMQMFHQGIDRPNLRLEAVDVFDDKEKLREIIDITTRYQGSGIIYFSLIKKMLEFSEILGDKGIGHGVYHGKLNAQERKRAQRDFLSGRQRLMLATNAFGMGIDKPDIRFVVHAELPSSVESYYQEIGRAGRDGQPSVCCLLYNQEDLLTQMEFIKWANPDADFYSALYDIICSELTQVNAMGADYLRERLSGKDRFDFRVETALAMLDRYGVTEGTVDSGTLTVVEQLPEMLQDDQYLKEKLLSDNKKLHSVVQYFRSEKCRKKYISSYFGITSKGSCLNCDLCDELGDEA